MEETAIVAVSNQPVVYDVSHEMECCLAGSESGDWHFILTTTTLTDYKPAH